MQLKSKNNLSFYIFNQLSKHKELMHGMIAELNLLHKEQERLQYVKESLGFSKLFSAHQVHLDAIALVDEASDEALMDFDALMTNRPNIPLLITHADCQCAFFFDPTKKAIANVHCGWRGNVHNIYAKVVRKMEEAYGSSPEDLRVAIGPSLGPCHAEFINYQSEFPTSFHAFQTKANHFDLWAISRHQLEEAGIQPEHIEIASLCTYSNKDFFSYRRQVKERGKGPVEAAHGSFLMMT